jgi:hypothetical protein
MTAEAVPARGLGEGLPVVDTMRSDADVAAARPLPTRSPGTPVDTPMPEPERLTLKGPALIDFRK